MAPMTKSKDLVPTTSKDLAVIQDDPAPMWAGAVKAILSEVHQLAQDHGVAPDDRRAGQQHLSRKLRDLVGRMDSGRWMDGRETLPEAEPAEQETIPLTQAPARPIDELLADDWQETWNNMDLEKRLRWAAFAAGNGNKR